jgi:eukaryotic-like serine/threonine-protein kinase
VEPGSTLKHYRIVSLLGKGGMGVVYRAVDTRLGRTVALKVLPGLSLDDDERLHRFEREARTASAINHPGVATLYDFDREGDTAFLTMEFVEGKTLRELLDDGPLPLPQLLDCTARVAEGMAAAHAKGVIHRDLKPENVMAADSGFYKILDFGLARMDLKEEERSEEGGSPTRMETVSRHMTQEGKILGTIAYMSPEQAQAHAMDARSDIFSFGTLLYELAVGVPPFRGNNLVATFHAIVHDDPKPMGSQRHEIPPELERITAKCLAKDPVDRYQTAADLAVDLRALRRESDSGNLGSFVSREHAPLRQGTRRLPRPAWLLAGAAALALAIAWSVWPERSVQPDAATPVAPATAADRNRIAVAFFANRSGNPEADWLSEALPEMLTTDLARTPDLEVLSTQRLYDLMAATGETDMASLDRVTTTQLARWAGAGVVVSGSIFQAGESYRIDVQAYDTASGQVLTASRVEGSDVFQMADRLSADLRQGLQLTAADRGGIQEVTTSSESAYREYTEGLKLFEKLRFAEASESFERSLQADGEFALAKLRLGMSTYLGGDAERGASLIREASEGAERLPERERLLTGGLNACLGGENREECKRHFAELRERFPDDVETYFWSAQSARQLGEYRESLRHLREGFERNPNDLLAVAGLTASLTDLDPATAERIRRDFLARNPETDASRLEIPALGADAP